MPTPSKFTAERRKLILEALQVGASRQTAAAIAGIDAATLTRWTQAGRDKAESAFGRFYAQVLEAEAHPRMRALGLVYRAMEDKPDLAWKFIERREPGFAPPMPTMPSAPAPVSIELTFHDGGALASSVVEAFIEGEAIEQDEPAEAIALPAQGSAASG